MAVVRPPMAELLAAATDALQDRPPGRAVIAPGTEAAWDDCCEGNLYVRLARLDPLYDQRGPSPGCGPPSWRATIALGIVRCVHSLDDNGQAPTAAQVSEDGEQGLDDMLVLLRVIESVVPKGVLRAQLGTWTPLGPSGGCAGGEWTVFWQVNAAV